jgi:phosphoglycolate phosphatase
MPERMGSSRTLVLFDLDGTLVDGQHSVYATFAAIFPRYGYKAPSRKEVRSIIGRSLPQAIGDLLGDDAPVMPMTEAYKAHFHQMRAAEGYTEALYDDVDAVIRRLAARDDLVLGTATGKALRGINWMIDRHGWHGFFATLQGADTAASKPAPDMVLNACRETGLSPADAIVFGDSIYDMQMAASAGATGVGVSWGYGDPADLVRAGASRIIDRFLDVEDAIADFRRGAGHG